MFHNGPRANCAKTANVQIIAVSFEMKLVINVENVKNFILIFLFEW